MSTHVDPQRGARYFIYNPLSLKAYNKGVLGLTNSRIWKCPTKLLSDQYARNSGRHHLDIGPGTGFHLSSIGAEEITLADINPATLRASKRAIHQSTVVHVLKQSIFDDFGDRQWDSIGVSYVLHCIPGNCKWDRLRDLKEHLPPGGRLFGSTIIIDHSTASVAAQALNSAYNQLGIFGNADDSEKQLRNALASYSDVSIVRRGQVLLFRAQR